MHDQPLVGIVPSLGKRYLGSFLVMGMGIVGSLFGIQRDRTCVNTGGGKG